MAADVLRQRCPRCGGELLRYVDPATDDGWVSCVEPECDYEVPDE